MAGIFYGVGVGPGDPALLTEKAKRCIEMADVLAVPGISAASAGAALAGISLARDQESVAVVPLGRNPEKYRALLDAADNLVLMKAGHCMPWIVQYMKEHGILPEQAVVFADLGLPGEYVGAPEADRDYGYFTTVIVNKKYDRT